VRLVLKNNTFILQVPSTWTQTHPQSIHLLQQETEAWQKTTWTFQLNTAKE